MTNQSTAVVHVQHQNLPLYVFWCGAVQDFWSLQNRALEAMNSYAANWCARRYAGTAAAQERDLRTLHAENPVEAARAWQDWAAGSTNRLMADGIEFWQQAGAMANDAVARLVLAGVALQQQSAAALTTGVAPGEAAAALMCVAPITCPMRWPQAQPIRIET